VPYGRRNNRKKATVRRNAATPRTNGRRSAQRAARAAVGAASPRRSARSRRETGGRTRVLVLHGPNLNLLGEREPEIYGHLTLGEVDARIKEEARALGVTVETKQSNHEGALIDALHAARGRVAGAVVNPGAFAHTSLALADAIRSVPFPVIEVHLSNVFARGEERHRLVTGGACRAVVSGLGWRGYVAALRALAEAASAGS
jgi:3-dehydroquinate dehydratase-2